LGATKGTKSTKVKATKSGRRVGLLRRPTAFGGPGDRLLLVILPFVLFVPFVATLFVIFVA